MSTRKSRLNTESPTHSGGESVPTTPTSLTTRKQRNVRKGKNDTNPETLTIKSEKMDEDEEAVKLNEDEDTNDSKKESAKESNTTSTTMTRKRRLTALKEEQNPQTAATTTAEVAAAAAEISVATTISAPSETTSPISPTIAEDGKISPTKTKRSRRSAIEILMESKPAMPRIAKRRNSTGKIEQPGRKPSSRIKKLKQMRKPNLKRIIKKPDKTVTTPINKPIKQLIEKLDAKSATAKKGKTADKNADCASDSELMKMSRRRSDSVSKCSDMTDTSSFQETKDSEDLPTTPVEQPPKFEIKQEIIEKDEENKVDATQETDLPVARSLSGLNESGDSESSQTMKTQETEQTDSKRSLRRLRRKPIVSPLPQKSMTTRSRSDTPNKLELAAHKMATETEEIEPELSPKQIKKETVLEEDKKPVENKKTSENVNEVKLVPEKVESLSPLPESEGVSEISVKQFYGTPDFLENNLGIEKDPKLGEIVQVHEKIRNESGGNGDFETNINEEDLLLTESETDVNTAVDTSGELDKSGESDDVVMIEEDDNKDNDSDDKCFVKPDEVRKSNNNSTLNENLIVLNGEIEVRPKDKTLNASKKMENDVSEVVIYTITNGLCVNPEKLEKILESQKLKEVQNNESPEISKNGNERAEAAAKTNGDYDAQDDAVQITDEIKEPETKLVTVDDKKKQLIPYTSPDATIAAVIQKNLAENVTADEPMEEDVVESKADVDESETESAMVMKTETNTEADDTIENNKENINKIKRIRDSIASSGSKDSRSSSIDDETPENLKQKESHLKTLGLLTHEAALSAAIEKQKRREQLKASTGASSSSSSSNSGKSKKNTSEYTGTLKTIIKLNRGNDKKKGRLPLKMTLHKGRGKNGSKADTGDNGSAGNSEEDTYYTIQNDMDNGDTNYGGHSRKTHNRSHTIDGTVTAAIDNNDAPIPKEVEKSLVIPEKASSFRYHPEKLCQDQCFYCGGKFGLFDTPCHVAQIKSLERQKKILENEEKLTVDNCLCDACFRHVDRRANCPSYKKRLSAPAAMPEYETNIEENQNQNESVVANEATLFHQNKEPSICKVQECKELATHSVRRKWALKMRRTFSKLININFEHNSSMALLSICDKHYDVISHLMICALCNRRLMRNHIYFINQESEKLNQLLSEQGIPVSVDSTPVVCKLCRYYANLLLKPQEGKKAQFVKNYRKRLLDYHNVEVIEDDSENESKSPETSKDQQDQQESSKRARAAKRARKSTPEYSTPSSSANSEDGQSKLPRLSMSIVIDGDTEMAQDPKSTAAQPRSERQRQKNKLLQQQQLLAEQQRVEQRVQQEQLKLKQQELLKKQQEELRQLQQQQAKLNNEEITILRTNPNISMRELFPGEEEMNINVSIPFVAGSWRTPEGWTKVTSTVQYDEPTRRLWEELQKPYGNQSSFLRHLILLEKYFRNGDLVLAPSANMNAMTYSESVQQRLQSYDNISSRPITLAQLVQNSANSGQQTQPPIIDLCSTTKNSAVPSTTLTANKTASNKPTDLTNSLLKTNATPNAIPRTRSYTITTEPINADAAKQQQQQQEQQLQRIMSAVKLIRPENAANSVAVNNSNNNTNNTNISNAPKTNKQAPGLPPELICINAPNPSDKQQQLLSQQLYQAQMQLTLQQHMQQQHQNSLLLSQQKFREQIQQQVLQSNPVVQVPQTQTHLPPQPVQTQPQVIQAAATAPAPKKPQQTNNGNTGNVTAPANGPNNGNKVNPNANVIRLPDVLTEAERRESKHWRPTLMPVTAGKNNTNTEIYQTADGRRLPALVQVQSGGKPYLISIHDYNRMCILRRERLLREQQEQLNKMAQHQPSTSKTMTTTSSTATSLNASNVITIPDDRPAKATNTTPSANHSISINKKVQIPNKILEQNSLIPITSSNTVRPINENSTDSLLKIRKNPSSLLKTNATVAATAIAIQPKSLQNAPPLTTPVTIQSKLPLSITSALSQSNVVSITSTPSISAILAMNSGTPSSTPPPIQIVPQPITITSVSSIPGLSAQSQIKASPASVWQWAESLNKAAANTNANGNNIIGLTSIDNSASSILSKIPKSLTVIPQQKQITSKASED